MAFASYSVKIIKLNYQTKRAINDTRKIYSDAVSYCAEIVLDNWDIVSKLNSTDRNNYVEKLVHSTKHNSAVYPFDLYFPKMPSYLRRAAVAEAIGIIASYTTKLAIYEEERYHAISNGKKFKKNPPRLNIYPQTFPTFYKGNTYKDNNDGTISIKLYVNHDWKYVTIQLRNQDLKYIQKQLGTKKNPSLSYSYGAYRIVFPFSFSGLELKSNEVKDQVALSVDLGINNDAVCSLVKGDGTVLGRFFIDMTSNKTNMYRLLNKLKDLQETSGYKAKQRKIWTKINGYRKNITNQVVHKIIQLAIKYDVDVIVMENLSSMKTKGKKQKIALWNKKKIINKIKDKAHINGIRYATINPRNTSALAFDGSGFVKRDKDNYSMCTFTTWKRYHSDLNASYNIVARYFIREYKKSMTEMEWSNLEAKVPTLSKRTHCTFDTMLRVVENL